MRSQHRTIMYYQDHCCWSFMFCLLPTQHLCFDMRNIALRRSIHCMVEGLVTQTDCLENRQCCYLERHSRGWSRQLNRLSTHLRYSCEIGHVVRDREYICVVLGGRLKFVEGGRTSYLQRGVERKISYVDDFIFKDRNIHGPFLDFIAFSGGVVVL